MYIYIYVFYVTSIYENLQNIVVNTQVKSTSLVELKLNLLDSPNERCIE